MPVIHSISLLAAGDPAWPFITSARWQAHMIGACTDCESRNDLWL
eukprot:COSAG01_NODE_3871_length_5604_cov_15.632334_13_plen_45_part_00